MIRAGVESAKSAILGCRSAEPDYCQCKVVFRFSDKIMAKSKATRIRRFEAPFDALEAAHA